MTEQDEKPAERPHVEVATELLILGMLADRVKAEIDKRRAEVAGSWAGSTSVTVEIPNESVPARPHKVGTVRADGGQGIARVADQDVWQAWCKANSSHNVTEQAAGHTSWTLDGPSGYALRAAFEAARVDFAAHPFTADVATRMLEVLDEGGYTLTRVTPIPARTVIAPAWETETLKATQKAGEPVCPDGQIPDGIEFVPNATPVKPVVVPTKNEDVRELFVAQQRARLAEITGSIAGEAKEARHVG